jgi:hypothetical protein
MAKLDRLGWAAGISMSCYGVRVGIRANGVDGLEALGDFLPPGWKRAASPIVDHLYSLRLGGGSASHAGVRHFHLLYSGAARLARTLDLEEALHALESDLQLRVAAAAPGRIFVHAGVVGWNGTAIVIPGRSFAGKTTLVAALVRHGARYYSDEYAVLDTRGRVHPYAKALSVRDEEHTRGRRCPVETLGGIAGRKPLEVGMVLLSEYRRGAKWRPRRLSPGQATLALLANTVPARDRPEASLAVLRSIVSHAPVFRGARGDASEMVEAVLTAARRLSDPS